MQTIIHSNEYYKTTLFFIINSLEKWYNNNSPVKIIDTLIICLGIIPTKGHFPSIEDKEFQKLITIGPMTRYAEDLKLAVKIMAGPMTDVLNLDEEVRNIINGDFLNIPYTTNKFVFTPYNM